MHPLMCATKTVLNPPERTRLSFETVLAHLTAESCGLSPSDLFRLFCRTAREFFDASGVCYCRASGDGEWLITESAGHPTWGAREEAVSQTAAEWIARAQLLGKAIPCRTTSQETPWLQASGEETQAVVPFLSRGELLGAALMAWPGASEITEEVVARLTLLGISFAGLLEHSRLFEQVHSSRERWVRVIDAIPDSIIVHNSEGKIVRINRPLAERLGVHPSKLIGRPIGEVLGTKQEESTAFCSLCSQKPEGAAGPVELLADGSFLVSTTKMALDDGADSQTIHVLVNIREKLEAERRYRDLFDSIQEGAFFCDPRGRMVEANHALLQMLGCSSREELLHKNLFEDLLSPLGRGRLLEELRDADILRNRETGLRRQDGHPLEALVHLTAVRDAQGTLAQYRGLILDITDQ